MEEDHFVYFISNRDRKGVQPVKIGYSKDPEKRLKRLQTGHPNKLEVLKLLRCGCEKDGRKLEKTLHWLAMKRFQRLQGEWFIIRGSWKKLVDQSIKLCRVELLEDDRFCLKQTKGE